MTKRERALIAAAMRWLEAMPCGGIGKDGYTAKELAAAELAGRNVEDDAELHCAQTAWRLLQEAMGEAKP